jgi:23S rRNA (cytidine1920-2'-O)/16S rRNA (cytidine1409-2'-O)-methyltransferase
MDAGASTGGFTDRLLQGGAAAVVAVDVGYGQFDWRLRNDPRVVLLERTNVRELAGPDLPWTPDAVVADLSFISLRSVLPVLARVAAQDADHVLLVKPQFEVGRRALKRGVVREPAEWSRALTEVVEAADDVGLGLVDVVLAEPPGPSGNREFFIHLRRGVRGRHEAIEREVGRATL